MNELSLKRFNMTVAKTDLNIFLKIKSRCLNTFSKQLSSSKLSNGSNLQFNFMLGDTKSNSIATASGKYKSRVVNNKVGKMRPW